MMHPRLLVAVPTIVVHRLRAAWGWLSPETRRWLRRGAGAARIRRAQLAGAARARLHREAAPVPHAIHARAFDSAALGRRMPYTLLLPHGYGADEAARFPVLYLLHGANSDHTAWATRTRLARDAAPYPLVIVCPEGENGCFINGADGTRWEDYLTADLPAHIEATCRVSAARGGRAVAGLSMGGFGAFNLALRHPARYCAIASHSGAFGIPRWYTGPEAAEQRAVLGPPGSATRREYDPERIAAAARRIHGVAALPAIALDCGAADWPDLRATNRALHETLTRLAIPHTYREPPGGHDWAYWDRALPHTLSFVTAAMGIAPPA